VCRIKNKKKRRIIFIKYSTYYTDSIYLTYPTYPLSTVDVGQDPRGPGEHALRCPLKTMTQVLSYSPLRLLTQDVLLCLMTHRNPTWLMDVSIGWAWRAAGR
jgi:hypothetical protein